MNIMLIIATIFFCIAGLDFITGNRLKLGESFERGLTTIVDLLPVMAGWIILSPWISSSIAPAITPVFQKIGCDPSLFPALFMSSDGGAGILGLEICLEEAAGLYNGMIVGSFLGITVCCTIPFTLVSTSGKNRSAAVKGLLIGFITIPIGCFFTGILAKIPMAIIMANTWPVALIAVILIVVFKVFGERIVFLFNALGFIVRFIAMCGLALGVAQEKLGFTLLELTPVTEAAAIICDIGVFLAGILPFMFVVQRLLSGTMTRIAQRMGTQENAVVGMIVGLANHIPVMINNLKEMDERGCMISVAFMTSACFAIGDHLAFAMAFTPEIAIQLMIGKIAAGLLGVVLAVFLARWWIASSGEKEMDQMTGIV